MKKIIKIKGYEHCGSFELKKQTDFIFGVIHITVTLMIL